jgi:hypothetical protein
MFSSTGTLETGLRVASSGIVILRAQLIQQKLQSGWQPRSLRSLVGPQPRADRCCDRLDGLRIHPVGTFTDLVEHT